MAIDTSYEDHYIQAFETARDRLPNTISLTQAKSAIRKYIARTDPRLKEHSVRNRHTIWVKENAQRVSKVLVFVEKP